MVVSVKHLLRPYGCFVYFLLLLPGVSDTSIDSRRHVSLKRTVKTQRPCPSFKYVQCGPALSPLSAAADTLPPRALTLQQAVLKSHLDAEIRTLNATMTASRASASAVTEMISKYKRFSHGTRSLASSATFHSPLFGCHDTRTHSLEKAYTEHLHRLDLVFSERVSTNSDTKCKDQFTSCLI